MPDAELDALFAEYGLVQDLELDGDLEIHLRERGTFGKHIVSFGEILEVLKGEPEFFATSPGRRALAVMVGPTLEGRFLSVPIEPTGRSGVWRAITAYTANTHHVERYRSRRE